MTLPNFLIIGAAKSGTTALYTYLQQHPEIYMSPRKELRYFSNILPKPEVVAKDYYHEGVSTLQEYENYFKAVTDEKAIGESSPMYLYTSGTAERIKAVLPEVKLIAILRNPIDRAYSAYTHALREWKEPSETFAEALALEPGRIKAGWGMLWHYTQAGFYYEQLNRYYRVFNQDQIKILLYDDLIADVSKLLREVFIFLEVESSFQPNTSKKPNISGFPRSKFIHKAMKWLFINDNLIKRISNVMVPKAIRKLVTEKMRVMNIEKRPLPLEMRNQLLDLYRDDLLLLEDLINRDLSQWMM